MKGRSLAEIAAFQWTASNQTILNDLRSDPDIPFLPSPIATSWTLRKRH